LLLASSDTFAQSTVGVPMNGALGQSARDAVDQNQNELINSEVQGGGRGSVSGGGLGPINSFGTGRLRTSDHDGVSPPDFDRFGYTTREASAFGNVVATIPGTVLGGQMKVSAFAGHNWLSLNLKSNSLAIFDPGQFARATNDAVFVGASALWAQQNTYALVTGVGMWGETKLTDGFDHSPDVNRYSFDTSGFIGSLTIGHVFNLGTAPASPKLDIRGILGHTRHTGDWFTQVDGFQQKYTFSMWTGTGGVTVFSNMTLQNNALLRPYVYGYVRQEWDYRNGLSVIDDTGVSLGTHYSDQAHTYAGLDAGATYAIGNMTLGAAFYWEVSGDERTLGGRLGASWKLGGDGGAKAPTAAPRASAPFSWTGFYVGANAGYAWSDVNMTYLAPDAIGFAPVGSSDTISASGATGGGQVGFNWQMAGIVVGVEGMWSAPFLKDERVGAFVNQLTGSENDHWRAEVRQLYSITGRLGLAAGNLLPYVKGGFAGAKVDTSLTISDCCPTPPHVAEAKSWHNGWTVGGGIEYMFAQLFTIGIEYDYYTFESKDVSAIRTVDLLNDRWAVKPDNIQTLTARMNFKLN
jgi:outer membrane immunogenic protein